MEPWPHEDVWLMAQVLAGECYEDMADDKRLVCEVILNRVSDGRFGGPTIYDVVSCTSPAVQFEGFWNQARSVSDDDIAVVKQALSDWYANGCEALSEYLYFSAGPNRENVFR